MNTKILALTILTLGAISAAVVPVAVPYCNTNATNAYCTATTGGNLSNSVCATITGYSVTTVAATNTTNATTTTKVTYAASNYCLPTVLIPSSATAQISLMNSTYYTIVQVQNATLTGFTSCSSWNDGACSTGTCCSSRTIGFPSGGSTGTTLSGSICTSAGSSGSGASMTMAYSFTGATLATNNTSPLTYVATCLPSSSAFIKYSVAAVAGLVALTFY